VNCRVVVVAAVGVGLCGAVGVATGLLLGESPSTASTARFERS
jgi:hypothetical protein